MATIYCTSNFKCIFSENHSILIKISPESIHKCNTGNYSAIENVLSYFSIVDQCRRACLLEFACFVWILDVIGRGLYCIFFADDPGWREPYISSVHYQNSGRVIMLPCKLTSMRHLRRSAKTHLERSFPNQYIYNFVEIFLVWSFNSLTRHRRPFRATLGILKAPTRLVSANNWQKPMK